MDRGSGTKQTPTEAPTEPDDVEGSCLGERDESLNFKRSEGSCDTASVDEISEEAMEELNTSLKKKF